jgi:glycerol uptake facilitator-like aquaporin
LKVEFFTTKNTEKTLKNFLATMGTTSTTKTFQETGFAFVVSVVANSLLPFSVLSVVNPNSEREP